MNERLEFLLDQIIRLQNKIEELHEEKDALMENNTQLLDDRYRYMMKLAEATECLNKIANVDFRGNRSSESVWAYQCLKKLEEK